jgi:hypothetical protein
MDQFQSLYQGRCVLITSEKHSQDLEWAKSTYGLDSRYYFFHGWAALDWYRGYNHSFLAAPWQQRRVTNRLFCPNNIISGRRHHRVRLVSAMCQRGLLSGNLVSFPAQCPFSQESAQEICEKIGVPSITTALPLVIDQSANHAHDSHRINFWQEAAGCFCHVVTETVYDDHRLHLTEKSFKPIVMEQPFVIVGPRGSLRYLREYGFQTFGSVWDESYDDLPGPERLDAIVDLLQDINSWSPERLLDTQRAVSGIVAHNHAWFYGRFQDILWQELTSMIDTWP